MTTPEALPTEPVISGNGPGAGWFSRQFLDGRRWLDRALGVAEWLNPVTGTPSASLETLAWVDSFGPSLMPRSSLHQGMAVGLAVLTARAIGASTEVITDAVVKPSGPLAGRLAVRGVLAGIGRTLERLPEDPDEATLRAGARTVGWMLWNGAVGGAAYDVTRAFQKRFPSRTGARPIIGSAVATAAVLGWGVRNLRERRTTIERWPIEQKNAMPAAMATGFGVSVVGTGMARGFRATRNGLIRYLGPGVSKNLIARVANAGLWALGGTIAYQAGVGYIGRSNEKIEPGYATPPTSESLSGSPNSHSPFEDLGLQGRRFVTDVVTPELIEEVMGEPAKAEPIRTFVGFNSEPLYPSGRAELALKELARTGAFDRSYLLLISPTGTGWVDQTLVESAEFLSRGDIATCCVQYGRFPSFLAIQKVALGRFQFRLLLWGIRQRLAERPPNKRPRVLVFGESLGAWTASDVVMFQGISGFDHYGIDRALWVGLPGMAKWSKTGMARGRGMLVPDGTVGHFDHPDDLEKLTDDDLERLRAVVLSHDNDPIAVLSPELAVQRPEWLEPEGDRGRGVPDDAKWTPILTFCYTAVDAMNAMVTVPGEFGSFGHDYRGDMARFVRDVFGLRDVTGDQVEKIEGALRTLELERSQRIKAQSSEHAPPSPTQKAQAKRRQAGGVPLQVHRTRGAKWFGKEEESAELKDESAQLEGESAEA